MAEAPAQPLSAAAAQLPREVAAFSCAHGDTLLRIVYLCEPMSLFVQAMPYFPSHVPFPMHFAWQGCPFSSRPHHLPCSSQSRRPHTPTQPPTPPRTSSALCPLTSPSPPSLAACLTVSCSSTAAASGPWAATASDSWALATAAM